MDFELDDEQRMLADSLDRLLADRYDFHARQGFRQSEPGWSREIWRAGADLGLFALPFPEAEGGLGGGPQETMLVMRALGRALALEPWLPTLVLAPALLRGDHPALTERIIAGGLQVAVSLDDDPEWRDAARDPLRSDGAGRLHGTRVLVEHGDSAGLLILAATGPDGAPGLWLVRPGAEGLGIQGYPTQDGRRAAKLTFRGVAAQPLAADDPAALIAATRARALAAICAEAVGAMERVLELTTDHLKTREQFGAPIGSFQGLQHQAAEMVVALEQARSMMIYATMMCADPDPDRRDAALSAAKVQIDRAATLIGQTAIQLHGGVGMTMDYAVGHYFKRLTLIARSWGDADAHLDRLAETAELP